VRAGECEHALLALEKHVAGIGFDVDKRLVFCRTGEKVIAALMREDGKLQLVALVLYEREGLDVHIKKASVVAVWAILLGIGIYRTPKEEQTEIVLGFSHSLEADIGVVEEGGHMRVTAKPLAGEGIVVGIGKRRVKGKILSLKIDGVKVVVFDLYGNTKVALGKGKGFLHRDAATRKFGDRHGRVFMERRELPVLLLLEKFSVFTPIP
jgi:hypothetical protein